LRPLIEDLKVRIAAIDQGLIRIAGALD
jgi:hypothetical protein